MLLNIKTSNATNIVINLPSDKIAYVQNVVDLFEQNAVFVNAGYSNIETVKPLFDITLGSSVVFNKNYHDETELAITSDKTVVIEDFEVATPEVLTSNKKAVESLKAKLKKQEDENKCLQMTIDKLKERIEELTNTDSDDE